MGKAFFLRHDDQIFGPMTGKELRDLAAHGKVAPTDLVKREDTEWLAATDVDGLFLPSPIVTSTVGTRNAAQSTFHDTAKAKKTTSTLPLNATTSRTYAILTGCSLGVIALSAFMPWATVFSGSVSGMRGDGKIVLILSIAAIAALLIGIYRPRWLSPATSLCMVWGTVAAVWMGVLLYKVATISPSTELKDNPFAAIASTQFGPGLGLYVGLVAGICSAIFAGMLCVGSTTPSSPGAGKSRFRWLAIGQGVAIPLAVLLVFLQLSNSNSPTPDKLSDADKREQQLLSESGKVLADLRGRTAKLKDRTERTETLTAKEERANQLVKGGTDIVEAWQQVGLIAIDHEARKVVVDSAWWSSWSGDEGGRTKMVTVLGLHFKDKTGKYPLTVFEDEGGKSVAMVHDDGEVVILR